MKQSINIKWIQLGLIIFGLILFVIIPLIAANNDFSKTDLGLSILFSLVIMGISSLVISTKFVLGWILKDSSRYIPKSIFLISIVLFVCIIVSFGIIFYLR